MSEIPCSTTANIKIFFLHRACLKLKVFEQIADLSIAVFEYCRFFAQHNN